MREGITDVSGLNEHQQTRLAIAALFAAYVKATDTTDDFRICDGFIDQMGKIYSEVRESEKPAIGVMETLTWTREFLANQLPLDRP